jgi:glucokinase
MAKPFVVVTGLPGSGKSAVAGRLAQALALPLLDKDNFLERLFVSKGVGDAEWRRALSRESDRILQTEAASSGGAVLVSHWQLPGMNSDSGTPTDWISRLSTRVVNVHCRCPVKVSAERFARRKRHPGHLDHQKSHEHIVASIRRVASYGFLDVGPRIEVDTSGVPDVGGVIHEVRRWLEATRITVGGT